ncbi:hypothetical protein CYY_003757 [Polysphondylium violaceum]|uniref:RRM domain-containing protein n=1 Tax=Polysphondylium violaceum TaxID=133409 RepID=A0A8J4V8D6_9MYCE|nr:hypothetical protein CYY_003757 [Polysphondylium violaceum]
MLSSKAFQSVVYCKSSQHMYRAFCSGGYQNAATSRTDEILSKYFPDSNNSNKINPLTTPVYSNEPMDPNQGLTDFYGTQNTFLPSGNYFNYNSHDNNKYNTKRVNRNVAGTEFLEPDFQNQNQKQKIQFKSLEEFKSDYLTNLVSDNQTAREDYENKLLNRFHSEVDIQAPYLMDRVPPLDFYKSCIESTDQSDKVYIVIENISIHTTKEDIQSMLESNDFLQVEHVELEKASDYTVAGEYLSGFAMIKLSANEMTEDFDKKIEATFKRLNLFGLNYGGIRYKTIPADCLKTIRIKNLPEDVDENKLKELLKKNYQAVAGKSIGDIDQFCKINFIQPRYKPHSPTTQKSSGNAFITFKDHLSAVNGFQLFSNINFITKRAMVDWSRSILSESSLSIQSHHARSKIKSFGEIELIKTIIDLKAQIRGLEEKILTNSTTKAATATKSSSSKRGKL